MFNIHDTYSLDRVLPEHLESLLSERDQLLNRLPAEKLMEILSAGESRILVDRGQALKAASSGVPVSSLATIFMLLFPVLIVSAVPLIIFASWQISILAVLGGIASFKASRHFLKEDVGQAALQNHKLLSVLMTKGVVWFELN